MNSEIKSIIRSFTAGETSLEDTNIALEAVGAAFRLDFGRNEITEEERLETLVGYYPNQASGYGLLDTGTGSLDKVRVIKGRLENPVNEVQLDGTTNCRAFVMICGKTYEVLGDRLADVKPDPEPPQPVQKEPDMHRRLDLANQVVEQQTARGRYAVTYDAGGYAVKAARL